jgi:hypothetical protein
MALSPLEVQMFITSFCTGHFYQVLIRAVLAENRSNKADLETFLKHSIFIVNHLAWPDPPVSVLRYIKQQFNRHLNVHTTLAAAWAYADLGRWDEATKEGKEALKVAEEY